jgi:WD40 repeat protein
VTVTVAAALPVLPVLPVGPPEFRGSSGRRAISRYWRSAVALAVASVAAALLANEPGAWVRVSVVRGGGLISPDGGRFVATAWHDERERDGPRAFVERDIFTGAQTAQFDAGGPCGGIFRYSPDGRRLATEYAGAAFLWDTHTGERIPTRLPPRSQFVGWSPTGDWLATMDPASVTFVNAADGSIRFSIPREGMHYQWGPEYTVASADGRRVAMNDFGASPIEVLDIGSGSIVRRVVRPGGGNLLKSFSRDGRFLAVAAGRIVRVCDVDAGTSVDVVLGGSACEPAQFVDGGRAIVIRDQSAVHRFDVDGGGHVRSAPSPGAHVDRLFVSGDGRTVYSPGNKRLCVYDSRSLRLLNDLPLPYAEVLGGSSDGERVVVRDRRDDGSIHSWDRGMKSDRAAFPAARASFLFADAGRLVISSGDELMTAYERRRSDAWWGIATTWQFATAVAAGVALVAAGVADVRRARRRGRRQGV